MVEDVVREDSLELLFHRSDEDGGIQRVHVPGLLEVISKSEGLGVDLLAVPDTVPDAGLDFVAGEGLEILVLSDHLVELHVLESEVSLGGLVVDHALHLCVHGVFRQSLLGLAFQSG